MSEWGAIIDALEVEFRAAVPGLPAGADGWERGIRPGQDLATGQLPHVFAHDPTDATDELEYHHENVQVSVQLDYWTRNETQEQVAAALDAFRDRIRANRTLTGLVDFAWCSARSVVEAGLTEKSERAGVVIVRTRKVA